MGFADLARTAVSTVTRTLGIDARYVDRQSGQEFEFVGVWSAPSFGLDIGNLEVRSSDPMLGVALDDLGFEPVHGNRVYVDGSAYVISDIHRDGQGGAKLELKRK